jgi:hypothetical protein
MMPRSLGSRANALGEQIDMAGDDPQHALVIIERPRPTTVERHALARRRNRIVRHDSRENPCPYP